MMLLKGLSLALLLLCLACSGGDKARLEHARFEIEQGNIQNARKYLTQIPKESGFRAQADSLLKTLENR